MSEKLYRFRDFSLFRRGGGKRGPVWYFYYKDSSGHRVKRSTGVRGLRNRKKAERYAAAWLRHLAAEHSPTVRSFAGDFFLWDKCPWIRRIHAKQRPFGRGSASARRGHLINYIFPRWGSSPFGAVTVAGIDEWLLGLEVSNNTKNKILNSFNIILREAQREGLLDEVPKVEPFGKERRRIDVFTLDELKALFPDDREALVDIWERLKYGAAFALLALTGLRSGELRALCWRHWISGRGALIIAQAVKNDGTIGTTKAGYERMTLVASPAARLLDAWRTDTPFPEEDDLIFYGAWRDRPMERGTPNAVLRRALVRAGIAAAERILTVRSFRHTYNTQMSRTLPRELLRAMIGHRDERMTDWYDNPTIEDRLRELEPAKALLESVWAGGEATDEA